MHDLAALTGPRTAPPWPEDAFVLDLDQLDPAVRPTDLLGLEHRTTPVVGVVRGRCDGVAMAAATCVQLLVAGRGATFRVDGPGSDLAIRRLVGLGGRRVAAYLAVAPVRADAALAWGLASRVAEDPAAVAGELADALTSRSRVAVEVIMGELGREAARDHTLSRVTSRALGDHDWRDQ